jgi:hypothetical protein
MRNKILTATFAILLSLSIIWGGEPSDTDWLASRIGGLDIEPTALSELAAKDFRSAEDRARLVRILTQARLSKVPLDEQTKKAVVITLKVLSERDANSGEAITPLLDASDREIRVEAAQSLAVIKNDQARSQLKKAALSRLPQITSSDAASQHEAIDLIRCALLAAQESERDTLMTQFIDAMKAQPINAENQRQIEGVIREIRVGVAQAN